MDAITNYQTLQDAMAGMILRPGDPQITENAALFIQLAEVDLYDRMLLREMETEEVLTLTQDENYVPLPAGFISPIEYWLMVETQRKPLSPRLPQDLPYRPESSIPREWAIDGENIRLDCPADSAYTTYLRFMKSSSLSDANASNYLLERRPDIYLYGSLKQCAIFIEDDGMLQKYATMYEAAINRMANAENRSRRTPLRTDLPGTWGRMNILTGQ